MLGALASSGLCARTSIVTRIDTVVEFVGEQQFSSLKGAHKAT